MSYKEILIAALANRKKMLGAVQWSGDTLDGISFTHLPALTDPAFLAWCRTTLPTISPRIRLETFFGTLELLALFQDMDHSRLSPSSTLKGSFLNRHSSNRSGNV